MRVVVDHPREGHSGAGNAAVRVVRRLPEEAEADPGPGGLQAGLLGPVLVQNALRATSWARPWPEPLAEAARCRHEEVRLRAWNTAVG